MDEVTTAPVIATESGFNPVAILIHLIAIAAGIFLGLQAMDSIAPDLSTDEPGIASSSEPAAVSGEDPDSLFNPANLAPALNQLSEQIPAGEGLVRLKITPGSLDAETASGDGLFVPEDISPAAPSVIVDQAQADRPRVGFEDIGYMELVATADGPRWYVQLDTSKTDVPPPWTYGAPLSGTPLDVGPGPPVPLSP